MWMGLKKLFQSKHLLIAGMALSTVPVILTFILVGQNDRLAKVYGRSIAIQSQLDDVNTHIKDWAILSEQKSNGIGTNELDGAAQIVTQDLTELDELLNNNAVQLKNTAELKRLWATLTSSTSIDSIPENVKAIDAVIKNIDMFEDQSVRTKQVKIESTSYMTKLISALSILLGVLMTIISIVVTNKVLKKERELYSDLKISEAKALESSRLKARFLATVSHEIRTPLNGIIGLSDVLRKMNIKDEELRFVDLIHSSGKTLLKIINDILDYSKIESGKIELENFDFSIRDTIEQVISTLRPKANEKSIHLDYILDENLPKALFGDASRISQILYNLIGNAIKFTSTGSVVLKVKRGDKSNIANVSALFSVSDTGVGLSTEQTQNIFEPFTQLQKIGTSGEAGTGLGLSICRQILKAMNSDIQVESKKDAGSRFYFELNFDRFSIEKLGAQPQSRKGEAVVRQVETKPIFTIQERPLILVVEDNPTNQITVQAMLSRLGAEVIIASNGQEAINMAEQTEVDLILMDCQMPIMDGFEATATLRRNHIVVPILAMTANASKEDQEACETAGMNGFITKPITLDILTREISTFLKPDPLAISSSVLQKLEKAIGPEGRSNVIQAFLSSLPTMRETLQIQIAKKDLFRTHQIGHQYRSSALTVGAIGLAHLFKQLENSPQIESLEKIAFKVEKISRDIEAKLSKHV